MAVLNGYEEDLVLRLNDKHKLRHERQFFTKLSPITRADKLQGNRHNSANKQINVIMPYHSGLTCSVKRVLKSQGINVCFQNRNNLKDLIGQVKHKKPANTKSGIYNIHCGDCTGNYVGQTKRRVETRVKEHIRAIRNKQDDKSAIAAHCIEERHQVKSYKLLKQVTNNYQLDAWESLYITKGQDLVNTGDQPIRSRLFEFATVKKEAFSSDNSNFSVTIES
jgi:hypothetical protein